MIKKKISVEVMYIQQYISRFWYGLHRRSIDKKNKRSNKRKQNGKNRRIKTLENNYQRKKNKSNLYYLRSVVTVNCNIFMR